MTQKTGALLEESSLQTGARALLDTVRESLDLVSMRSAIQHEAPEDVIQEAFLDLYSKANDEPELIQDLSTRGKLRTYTIQTIFRIANLQNSSLNRKMRRHTEIPTLSQDLRDRADDDQEAYDYEELVASCPVKLESIYWYQRDLLKLYLQLGTYRAVEEYTGIPRASVFDAVKKAKIEMERLLWE